MTLMETPIQVLIEGSRTGDGRAFQQLYDLLAGRVFSYVRSRIGSRDDALDCTQQVFIELWKALARFRYQSDPQFYAFVFTITKRQIIRLHQLQKRLPDQLNNEEYVADTPHDGETSDLVERLLKNLSELDREIIILHHWSRYTFNEIAEMLTLNESAVRVRHHRALQTLKNKLIT